MPTAYLVDSLNRKITPFENGGWRDMRRHLPGGLCVAMVFETGDVLYVDDEGMMRPATSAFRLKDRPDGQPMMGHGILSGPDKGDDTLDAQMTIAELAARIEWLDLQTALDWFRSRANEGAVTFTDVASGKVEILQTWGSFLREMEPPKKD